MTFHTGNGRAFYTGHDSSVGGSLPKRAVQRNGQWFLQKYDPYSDGLRNVNEAFAAYLHQLQGFSRYTPYKTGTDQNGRSFCECPYFTDETHELVSAADIVSTCYGKDTVSNFVNVCSENGLSRDEVEQFLDYQTLTDFLISNTDRHPDNFGILRDPDTMRFLSMAPIYDSGTSMGCNGRILSDRQLLYGETNNVIPAFAEALKRVHNRNAVDLSHVPDKTAVLDFYLDHGVSRLEACKIAALYGRKVKMLSEFQGGKNIEELIPERGEPER